MDDIAIRWACISHRFFQRAAHDRWCVSMDVATFQERIDNNSNATKTMYIFGIVFAAGLKVSD